VVIGWLLACPPGGRNRQAGLCQAVWLPGSARDVGRDDIRGVPVQAPARPVVPDRGPRVSVGGSLLNVAQRHAGVLGSGDECVPERVRSDGLGDPGAARDLADDPPGTVPVQPAPVSGEEDRAVAAFPPWPGRSPARYAAPVGQ